MSANRIKGLKPNQESGYSQGYFRPSNPHKYKGDPSNIIYRSSWEKRFCQWVDVHPNIKCWLSEEVKIPYINPCARFDSKTNSFQPAPANYYVDYFIQIEKEGKLESWFIEVKPNMQVPTTEQIMKLQQKMNESNLTAKKIKQYNYQLKTLAVNRAKFLAAKKFAEERGCKFAVVDENFLF